MIAGKAFGQTWTEKDYTDRHVQVLELIRTNHTIKAMKETIEIEKHANTENNRFGLFVSNDIKGHLYHRNMESQEAISHFHDALKYCTSALDTSHVLVDLSGDYRISHEFKKAEDCLRSANAILAKPSTKRKSNYQIALNYHTIELCKLYYATENTMAFKSAYNKLKNSKSFSASQKEDCHLIDVYNYILGDNLDKALETCLSYWPDSHYDVRSAIFEKMGRYMEARKAWVDNIYNNDAVTSAGQKKDINEISAELGNFRLLVENQRLAMHNTTLQLNAASLELNKTNLALEQSKQNALLQKAQERNDQLLIDKKSADLAVLKARDEKKKAEEQRKKNEQDRHYMLLFIGNAVAILLVLVLFYTLAQAKKRTMRLTMKNIQLEKARLKAEESDRNKTAFMQHVSHEVRTPLNAVAGFAQLLTTPGMAEDKESVKEMKDYIINSSATMKEILNDIMELAAIDDNNITLNNEPVNINNFCRELIESVKPRCPEGVTLVFDSNTDDDSTITTDRKRLSQIINNLLTNAEKHTEKGHITLEANKSEDNISLSVSDTGCGIPEEMREYIFEKFSKLDSFKQGFGLGLGISRDLARLMGGDLTLDASYTDGARFVLSLKTQA